MKKFTINQLAKFIDHTNLKANATKWDMEILCDEAKKYNFKMVAINQVQSKVCYEFLKNSDVNVGAAISFPLGQTSIETKVFETENAIKLGADEIDYVINLSEVKARNWKYLTEEMEQIISVCKKNDVMSKVIFENTYLDDKEKIELCKIAKKVKPDFIKTSTGFASSGAKFSDIKLDLSQYFGHK